MQMEREISERGHSKDMCPLGPAAWAYGYLLWKGLQIKSLVCGKSGQWPTL